MPETSLVSTGGTSKPNWNRPRLHKASGSQSLRPWLRPNNTICRPHLLAVNVGLPSERTRPDRMLRTGTLDSCFAPPAGEEMSFYRRRTVLSN
jgi:hypothetical protein